MKRLFAVRYDAKRHRYRVRTATGRELGDLYPTRRQALRVARGDNAAMRKGGTGGRA